MPSRVRRAERAETSVCARLHYRPDSEQPALEKPVAYGCDQRDISEPNGALERVTREVQAPRICRNETARDSRENVQPRRSRMEGSACGGFDRADRRRHRW